MIGCPYCGTMNRKGSRYCSKCGERLDTVPSTRCPACNAPNLSSSENCAFCGASLEVQGEGPEPKAVMPPSIPASASTEEPDTEAAELEVPASEALPSWLYDLATEEQEPAVPVAAPHAVPEQRKPELNRYLQDLGGVFPKTDGWLSQSLARRLTMAGNRGQPPEGA
jgi:hypothetical protein